MRRLFVVILLMLLGGVGLIAQLPSRGANAALYPSASNGADNNWITADRITLTTRKWCNKRIKVRESQQQSTDSSDQ